MKTYLQRLKKFDKDYFKEWDEPKDENQLASWLATYLYDTDFDLDKESWDGIMRVRGQFPEIWWDVLERLFKRQHDT